jgi:transcriptional regulator with XRE-family HTH domain
MDPKRITRIRNAYGLTQQDFARALGVSTQTIWYWEKGRFKPNRFDLVVLTQMEAAIGNLPYQDRVRNALHEAQVLPPDQRAAEGTKLGDLIAAGAIAVGLVVLLEALFGDK